jgi:hypothetical protein
MLAIILPSMIHGVDIEVALYMLTTIHLHLVPGRPTVPPVLS